MRVLALFLFVATAWAASEPLVVALHADVTVPRARVTLADIATLSGTDAAIAGTLVVQDLPDTSARTISAHQVRAVLAGVAAGSRLDVRGESRVQRAVESVSAEALQEAARQHMVAQAGDGAEVTFRRPPSAVIIPADDTEPWTIAVDPLVHRSIGEVPVRLRVCRGGHDLARALAVAHVALVAEVAVPVRPLARGDLIGFGDLRMSRIDLTTGRWDTTSIEALVGSEVRLPLAADAPIPTGAVRMPPVVRGGGAVEIAITTDGFTITTSAQALGDGQIGDTITVRRGTDGRTMSARVTGPGQVTVSP